VEKEFEHSFNGTDFVHGYEYDVVEDKFNLNKIKFETLIYSFIKNPENDKNNFLLGLEYENKNQNAAAVSFYLRTAERTEQKLLKYECLLRAANCFEKQGTRKFTCKGLLQHAVSILPERPEAYYFLSKFYENQTSDGHWNDAYMIACVGEKYIDKKRKGFETCIGYPGDYAILFQKAVSSWWCGLCDESRTLFINLYKNKKIDSTHKKSVIFNLKKFNIQNKPFDSYEKFKHHSYLKNKFNGCEKIIKNYSEAYQDIFILTCLNGKQNGTYLEIGSADPYYGNNTALLESVFDWKGIAIDFNEKFASDYNQKRKNRCLCKNANELNYEELLCDFPDDMDYLQLDCDPPEVTYEILKKIPFQKKRFAVITYEHDAYCDETMSFQQKSGEYLESHGYLRIINNLAPDEWRNYEDWWVHPGLVPSKIISKILCINDEIKKASDIFLRL